MREPNRVIFALKAFGCCLPLPCRAQPCLPCVLSACILGPQPSCHLTPAVLPAPHLSPLFLLHHAGRDASYASCPPMPTPPRVLPYFKSGFARRSWAFRCVRVHTHASGEKVGVEKEQLRWARRPARSCSVGQRMMVRELSAGEGRSADLPSVGHALTCAHRHTRPTINSLTVLEKVIGVGCEVAGFCTL